MQNTSYTIEPAEHERDTKAFVKVAKAAKTPEDVVRCYRIAQLWETAAKAVKTALKGRMEMTIPAGVDSKPYVLPDMPGGRLLARRVGQDRRKIAPAKLTALLVAKNAPEEAFERVGREDYAAVMVKDGRITTAELEACLEGSQPKYVSLTWEPEDKSPG
jgi:hypothetical protein